MLLEKQVKIDFGIILQNNNMKYLKVIFQMVQPFVFVFFSLTNLFVNKKLSSKSLKCTLFNIFNDWVLKGLHSSFPFSHFLFRLGQLLLWHSLQRTDGTFLMPEACQSSSEKFSHSLTPGSPTGSRSTETVRQFKGPGAVIGISREHIFKNIEKYFQKCANHF